LIDVDRIIDKYGNRRRFLIAILQDIQVEERHLPKEALCRVAQRLGMPLVDVYGVATFYSAFSLEPRGEHEITVCVGTACHVRGSRRILEEFERQVGIEPGLTTTAVGRRMPEVRSPKSRACGAGAPRET